MGQADDLQQRLNAISIPELSRRIDRVVGHLRELRRSMAVHAGMTLERAPEPIPPIDSSDVQEALDLIVELLPVLRAPLSPEQREALHLRSAEEREALDEAMEAMARMDPEEFNQIMNEAGSDAVHADLLLLQEGAHKMEMLAEVGQEIQEFQAELHAFREKLLQRAAAAAAAMLAEQGSKSTGKN